MRLTGPVPRPIDSVLVANRGEIAVRILRAAAEHRVRAVAVHTGEDAGALHVRSAEAAAVVPSYLDASAIVAAALAMGVQAVHPGYGFLAENAEFARAVQAAGLVWIGPPPQAIALLGDKVAARRIAVEVGAPLVAGTENAVADVHEVEKFAAEHGFPLLIKAAHGGGGRGMKVVRDHGEIADAHAAAVREASAAFGRGECYVERFLEAARHVEAQVLADVAGTVVVVGTRDCSVQRRNQKLIEEAPAPFLDAATSEAVHASAAALCRAAGYVGAGTVEYLLDAAGTLTFLEVNTRLQVEHPVTEETTGVDLVAEQFRIAGGALLTGVEPAAAGHAIEFRLVAEDAGSGFLPVPGTLRTLTWPSGPGIRVDTGVEAGDMVDGRYDSMFAKLVVSGPNRATTLRRAGRALASLRIEGVPTPLALYRLVVEHPDFAESFAVHNRWLEEDFEGNVAPWRPEAGEDNQLIVRVGRRPMTVTVPGLDGLGETGERARTESASLRAAATETAAGPAVSAPMQGTIVSVVVADGDRVEPGDLLAVLEAMKMENPIRAHRAGTVEGLAVHVGATVAQRALVCRIVG
ncbi:MAG: acetyl/propionyl/methylcrotonyl-CoA carboxylase subunit alpha [Sporichthyaceae bacterium]